MGRIRALIACLLTGVVLSGCVSPVVEREILSAIGPSFNDAPVLRNIRAGSAAEGKLYAGDQVISVGSKHIASLQELWPALMESNAETFLLERDGSLIELPITVLADVDTKTLNAFPLDWGETFTVDKKSVTGPTMRSGYVLAGRLDGQVAASVWKGRPDLLEIELQLFTPENCTDCRLRNVAVMDLSRKAWLSIVPIEQAAFAVVPEIGQPAQPVEVPPPTLVSATSTTTMQGNVNAQSYGNTTYGTYSGSAYTTTTPIYDYSNQYAALGHNLGVAIQNARIETANRERLEFANIRLGNLRVGALNPGEIVTGHLFFAAPIGFDGPYMVFVDAGENAVGFTQFAK